ncbi:MAG TPA: hypothetical protein VFF04_07110, partial [Candidatus Babeliales bacterium]|nr:hypothetical protein [Candidatus Babeliales bacterium]
GDMLSLIEKAESTVKQSEQERMYKSFMQGSMTLQDFADQIGMVNQLGSLTQLTKYLPGMGAVKISPDMVEKGEKDLKRFKAIINSMTPKERLVPQILNGSRKSRIAKGAGVTVADVNMLLARFEETQQYAKLFKKFLRK